ncbi:MAG: protein-L-isoaspartate O-methyltransferase [Thermoplasmata archaeon]|nr:protein-L-isoaspartate O-methyltransferase [Thermoplasmata archaeon]
MNGRADAAAPWEERAREMVDALRPLSPRVADAMLRVARHRFVPAELASEAYDDTPLPLGFAGSTISAPHMIALMLEWAELVPGLRVLELGSGSGYLAALLAELVRPGGRVVGVEVESRLAEGSKLRLAELGYGEDVAIHVSDARAGWPLDAPYNRILVSFATPMIFPEWTAQLGSLGVLLAPVGPGRGQVLQRLRRGPNGDRLEDGPECIFVGLSPAGARPK